MARHELRIAWLYPRSVNELIANFQGDLFGAGRQASIEACRRCHRLRSSALIVVSTCDRTQNGLPAVPEQISETDSLPRKRRVLLVAHALACFAAVIVTWGRRL